MASAEDLSLELVWMVNEQLGIKEWLRLILLAAKSPHDLDPDTHVFLANKRIFYTKLQAYETHQPCDSLLPPLGSLETISEAELVRRASIFYGHILGPGAATVADVRNRDHSVGSIPILKADHLAYLSWGPNLSSNFLSLKLVDLHAGTTSLRITKELKKSPDLFMSHSVVGYVEKNSRSHPPAFVHLPLASILNAGASTDSFTRQPMNHRGQVHASAADGDLVVALCSRRGHWFVTTLDCNNGSQSTFDVPHPLSPMKNGAASKRDIYGIMFRESDHPRICVLGSSHAPGAAHHTTRFNLAVKSFSIMGVSQGSFQKSFDHPSYQESINTNFRGISVAPTGLRDRYRVWLRFMDEACTFGIDLQNPTLRLRLEFREAYWKQHHWPVNRTTIDATRWQVMANEFFAVSVFMGEGQSRITSVSFEDMTAKQTN